jgi:choline transport protein
MASISSQIAVAMYGIYHPTYTPERWHVFIGYIVVTWACCSVVLFANKSLPMINNIGLFFILVGVTISIIVCAVMPHVNGSGYVNYLYIAAVFEISLKCETK